MGFIKKYATFFIILLYCIFYITQSFPWGTVYYQAEEEGLLNYGYVNFHDNTLWSSSNNFGSLSMSNILTYTEGRFWALGELLHLSLHDTQKLFYFIIIFCSVFFSYLAFKMLSKRKWTALLLSLIYVATPVYFGSIPTLPALIRNVFLPMTLYLWLQFMQTKQFRYIALNTLALYLTFGMGLNAPQLLGAYGFILLFILLSAIFYKTWVSAIYFSIPYFLFIGFDAVYYHIYFTNAFDLVSFDLTKAFSQTPSTSLSEILRFFGFFAEYGIADGIYYDHLVPYYHSFLGVLASFIPITILLFLLLINKNSKKKTQMLALLIICILLVKGGAPPFERPFTWLYDNLLFFKMFRNPWTKFMMNFVIAVLVAIAYLSVDIRYRTRQIVTIGLIVYFIYITIPLIQGRAFDKRNIGFKESKIVIPSYWIDLHNYSKTSLTGKRVLVLPASIGYRQMLHRWTPYPMTGKPEMPLLYADLVRGTDSDSQEGKIGVQYFKNISPSVISISSIDYVLDQRDTTPIRFNPDQIIVGFDTVSPAVDIHGKKTFGLLDLYPVKKELRTDKLRTVNHLVAMDKPCEFENYNRVNDIKTSAVITKNSPLLRNSVSETQITINRISNAEYKITFTEAPRTDIGLLFMETYSKGWQLYEDRVSLYPISVKNVLHSPANCFGNLWIIPQEYLKNHNSIKLLSKHQIDFQYIKLSIYSALVLHIIAGWILFKKYRKR